MRDAKALQLRARGRSYAAIARMLGFAKAIEAVDAFNRALQTKTKSEQATLRRDESARLDKLASGLRDRSDLDKEARARKLDAVERVRQKALAG